MEFNRGRALKQQLGEEELLQQFHKNEMAREDHEDILTAAKKERERRRESGVKRGLEAQRVRSTTLSVKEKAREA